MGPETLTLAAPPRSTTSSTAAASPTLLAPGFRFHPTDEELVIYYLKRKVAGKPFRFNAISEVDIYKSEPWELAGKSRLKSRDQEYYFFSALDKKYGNGARMNRATGQGYWKATGNDRPVRHDSRTVGLKKTLVFHSGRAPDGKRTNWVMHEYRLVDEELEKAGAGIGTMQDAYVLCRVFHKSNLGPPNGHRYAPFVEEEWDDGNRVLVPGEETTDLALISRNSNVEEKSKDMCAPNVTKDACIEGKNAKQETQLSSKAPLSANEPPKSSQNTLMVCKNEKLDSYIPPSIIANPKPFTLMRYKRKRLNDSNSDGSNASENSTRTSEEPCSSTTTNTMMTPVSPTRPTTRNFLSALVEYSLLESIEAKETTVLAPSWDVATLGSSVHPSILKFIQDLKDEIHKISMDREKLKFEVMSAQAMISILQSRVDPLNRENEDLKRVVKP